MFDQQLTIDGGAEDIAPNHRQDRLFNAPKTIKGQIVMEPEPRAFCPRCGATHPSLAAVCFGSVAPHAAVKMEPIA